METKEYILLVDGSMGIYCPQITAKKLQSMDNDGLLQINGEIDFNELSNVDNEFYWDAWDEVLNGGVSIWIESDEYFIEQEEGDVWLVAVGG